MKYIREKNNGNLNDNNNNNNIHVYDGCIYAYAQNRLI